MKIINLIIEFFKTGLFAVGGGLATIPFLKEMIEKFHWFTLEELQTMIAVSESTPGPIGVNMASYVGFSQYGVLGSIITTLSLVAPSFIVVCLISKALDKYKNSFFVNSAFKGLKPAVVALIMVVVIQIMLNCFVNVGSVIKINYVELITYAIILVVVLKFKKLHPIIIIILSALLGLLLGL